MLDLFAYDLTLPIFIKKSFRNRIKNQLNRFVLTLLILLELSEKLDISKRFIFAYFYHFCRYNIESKIYQSL